MAELVGRGGGGRGNRGRVVLWGLAALLLLLPWVANAQWTAFDYAVTAVLLGGTGLVAELVVRRTSNTAYRAAAGLAVAAALLSFVANGAVGMIGSEDNGYNLFFIGVIGLALAGAAAARFRASGMALAMLVAGLVHSGVALYGTQADMRGGIFSLGFAGLWLLSAALFRKAAEDGRGAAA